MIDKNLEAQLFSCYYDSWKIQRDLSEQVSELQTIEKGVCPGSYELRFAQATAYFDRGKYGDAKKIAKELKKELNGKDPYISRLYVENDPCPCGSGKKYKKCCGR